MKKSSFIAILTIAFACLAADSLLADTFNFNTGQAGVGSQDTVYTVLAGSSAAAFGVTPVDLGGGNTWVTPPAGSNWISQHTDAANHALALNAPFANPATSASTFTYQTQFNLNAATQNLAAALFSNLQVAVDNAVSIKLNGTTVGTINQTPLDSNNVLAFNTLVNGANAQHNFNLNPFIGLLVNGINSLTFIVNNTPAANTPEGLLVNGSLTLPTDIPGPVPEPASMIAWALVGGIGAVLGYRRRRNVS